MVRKPGEPDAGHDRFKRRGASALSFVITFFMALALWAWFTNLDTKPVPDGTENKGFVDELANAKDLVTYVGAFFTIMVGYWLGSNGKDKAEQKADDAQKETEKAKANEKALVAAATPDIVKAAIDQYGYEIGTTA